MTPRTPMVAGNWKMNGDRASNDVLIAGLRSALAMPVPGVDIVVCPPFPYLAQAGRGIAGLDVTLGAQNVSAHPNGAHTGEVSASMLADSGCRWVIVGHSERRSLLGEADGTIADKARAGLVAGLGVVACIGESLQEREAGRAEAVLARQVDALLPVVVDAMPDAFVLAYEPVWAIGTGRTASPEIAQQAHGLIRERLARAGVGAAPAIRILYGGSVKASNAASLFAMPDIDGGLIGGASLVADEFIAICRAASAG